MLTLPSCGEKRRSIGVGRATPRVFERNSIPDVIVNDVSCKICVLCDYAAIAYLPANIIFYSRAIVLP